MRLISNEELLVVAGGDGDGDLVTLPIEGQDFEFEQPMDWCTAVPDQPFGYDFSGACQNHDANYGSTSLLSRLEADNQFLVDMKAVCASTGGDVLCYGTAYVYYLGVRIFGASNYEGSN
ncbi:MAG: phospholipase A2 [Candidatus Aquirickettsiella gammari]